ncbi:MAG TPA: hypothetical protein VLG76_00590 [Rhabdochlamydiaceae bacterium]|nr:hypothetical protein [Rhabdochlamydiaceae bacterium]
MNPLIEKFKQVRAHPLFFFLALPLALLPSLIYALYFFNRIDTLDNFQEQVYRLAKKSETLKSKKEEEDLFLKKLKAADHFYIDKCLEAQVFLEPEFKRYQAILAYDSEDLWTKRRVQFLTEGTNQLRFSEQNLKSSGGFQEVEEVQQRPVEMNLEDLKKLLSNIEEVEIGSFSPHTNGPQLIIKNFDLTRKKLKEQEEVYLINLQLIKREITQ